MPAKGQIDQEAVKRYHQMFDCIDKYGVLTADCHTLEHKA